MEVMKAVFDTNILIDYLNGINAVKKELLLYEEIFISIISWMEVLIGSTNIDEEKIIRQFLNRFTVLALTNNIAEKAIEIRKKYKIRLPNSVIWASALYNNCVIVTRNTKDFPENHPSVRIPYKI
jgi:predicted nucleic acid-binding protein